MEPVGDLDERDELVRQPERGERLRRDEHGEAARLEPPERVVLAEPGESVVDRSDVGAGPAPDASSCLTASAPRFLSSIRSASPVDAGSVAR